MSGLGVVLLIVLGLAALVVGYVIFAYNTLVSTKNGVENAWGQVDVALKRRHDLIPNLVEVAKDYMGYEQETLQAVVEARNKAVAGRGAGPEQAVPAEGLLSAALGRFFAVAEDYPDLKANENLRQLTDELARSENMIANARDEYNDAVLLQNTRVEVFPSNLVARRFGFQRAVYFEIPESEKQPVKVDLR